MVVHGETCIWDYGNGYSFSFRNTKCICNEDLNAAKRQNHKILFQPIKKASGRFLVLIGCGSEQADHIHSDYNAVNYENITIDF